MRLTIGKGRFEVCILDHENNILFEIPAFGEGNLCDVKIDGSIEDNIADALVEASTQIKNTVVQAADRTLSDENGLVALVEEMNNQHHKKWSDLRCGIVPNSIPIKSPKQDHVDFVSLDVRAKGIALLVEGDDGREDISIYAFTCEANKPEFYRIFQIGDAPDSEWVTMREAIDMGINEFFNELRNLLLDYVHRRQVYYSESQARSKVVKEVVNSLREHWISTGDAEEPS